MERLSRIPSFLPRTDAMFLLLPTSAHDDSQHLPDVAPPSVWLPTSKELAALGPVVCTWRRSFGSELNCLLHTRLAIACVSVSPLGVSEWIACITAEGHCCMRFHPLPDATQQRAWVQLLERLPAECTLPFLGDGCTRLLSRISDWLRGEDWRGSALMFHPHGQVPAATMAVLNPRDTHAMRAVLATHGASSLV
jgi:hypothetical protein